MNPERVQRKLGEEGGGTKRSFLRVASRRDSSIWGHMSGNTGTSGRNYDRGKGWIQRGLGWTRARMEGGNSGEEGKRGQGGKQRNRDGELTGVPAGRLHNPALLKVTSWPLSHCPLGLASFLSLCLFLQEAPPLHPTPPPLSISPAKQHEQGAGSGYGLRARMRVLTALFGRPGG